MRAKIFVVLESVFLGLGMLILTPSANPTAAGAASSPSQMALAPLTTTQSKLWHPQPAEAAGDMGVHHQLVRR